MRKDGITSTSLLIIFLITLGIQNTNIPIRHMFFLSFIFLLFLLFLALQKRLKLNKSLGYDKKILFVVLLIFLWKLILLTITPYLNQGFLNVIYYIILIVTASLIIECLFSLQGFILSAYISTIFLNAIAILGGILSGDTITGFRIGDTGLIIKRYGWLYTHPNTAGLYLAMMVILSLIYMELKKNKFNLLITLLGIVALYFTDSRTSLYACFLYVLIRIIIIYYNRIKHTTFKYFITSEFFLLVTLISFLGVSLFFYNFSTLNYLFSDRLKVWQMVLSSEDNIIVGQGLFLPGQNLIISSEKNGADIDGLFVHLLYSEGIVGFLLFIILFSFIFYKLLKVDTSTKYIAISIFIITMFFSITESVFWSYNFFSIFILGVIFNVLNQKRELDQGEK